MGAGTLCGSHRVAGRDWVGALDGTGVGQAELGFEGLSSGVWLPLFSNACTLGY